MCWFHLFSVRQLRISKVFDYAAMQPVVLLLDEFDAIARLTR